LYFVLLENNRKRHGVSIIKRDWPKSWKIFLVN
jgi:hypothetical protein